VATTAPMKRGTNFGTLSPDNQSWLPLSEFALNAKGPSGFFKPSGGGHPALKFLPRCSPRCRIESDRLGNGQLLSLPARSSRHSLLRPTVPRARGGNRSVASVIVSGPEALLRRAQAGANGWRGRRPGLR
jgi:hypothetical protein